ncbi:unnamed protein product, partial [Polarella glacialis]
AACTLLVHVDPAPGPGLQAVEQDLICGSPPSAGFLAENPVPGTAAEGSGARFEVGVVGPSPGLWRLCLCRAGCFGALSYIENVGDVLVRGVASVAVPAARCIAGGPPCEVQFTGLGLSLRDQVGAVLDPGNCTEPPWELFSLRQPDITNVSVN